MLVAPPTASTIHVWHCLFQLLELLLSAHPSLCDHQDLNIIYADAPGTRMPSWPAGCGPEPYRPLPLHPETCDRTSGKHEVERRVQAERGTDSDDDDWDAAFIVCLQNCCMHWGLRAVMQSGHSSSILPRSRCCNRAPYYRLVNCWAGCSLQAESGRQAARAIAVVCQVVREQDTNRCRHYQLRAGQLCHT